MIQSTTKGLKIALQSILLVVFVLVSFFGSFTISLAAPQILEDQFQVNVSVTAPASDIIAPSVPTSVIATAVSTSQINLSWNASTDNVGVAGYKIYRNSVYFTTVVGTTYSDIGLLANTLYGYTVSAIDVAANESAQSSIASATTFAIVSTPPGGGNSGGTPVPRIYDVVIVPTQTGAVVTYKTTVPARGTLSWGLTSNLEAGSVAETVFSTEHTVTLSGLLSGTTYQFGIEVISGYGRLNTLNGQQFTTLPAPQENPNASRFTATAKEKTILLKWNNPISSTFSEVRIVRSESFYPSDPSDGEVVYEGVDQVFEDDQVLIGTRYYYTLFAKDVSGSYSSGILASARIKIPGEVTPPDEEVFPNLPQAPNVNPIISALTFFDFDFIQNGARLSSVNGKESVSIDGTKDLTVSLDYRKVPEVLKTIAITLTDPTDPEKTFSFLLRVNRDKTLYTATIGALGNSGTYKVTISIVDYKNRGLKTIAGQLVASAEKAFEKNQNIFRIIISSVGDKVWYIIFIGLFAAAVLKSIKEIMDGKRKKKLLVCAIDEGEIKKVW